MLDLSVRSAYDVFIGKVAEARDFSMERADEVAQGILFVIQNDFVTGTTVDVDGGWLLS